MAQLYIEGTRGQIIGKINQIFGYKDSYVKTASGYDVFTCRIQPGQKDECLVGIVRMSKGFMVETFFPNQEGVYDRLWMCDPFIGHVSYIETSNPDLMNLNIAKIDPTQKNMELYSMPEDLDLLNNLLGSAVVLAKTQNTDINVMITDGLKQTNNFL